MEEYLSLREVGQRLGLSFAELAAMVDRGELAAYRLNEAGPGRPSRTVVRILQSDVDAIAKGD